MARKWGLNSNQFDLLRLFLSKMQKPPITLYLFYRNQELAHKSQIEKLQTQVEELYERYRYEADARKLLISDYNDLKFRQEEQKGEESGGQEEREDPVLLKLKLAYVLCH